MKHPPTIFIYALLDPRDGETRYIGQSKSPFERAAHHGCRSASSRGVIEWRDELRSLGLKPELVILREVPALVAHDAERDAIHLAVLSGHRLLNVHNVFKLKTIWGTAA